MSLVWQSASFVAPLVLHGSVERIPTPVCALARNDTTFEEKNKPLIPQSGRKAFLPRYHPQFAYKKRSFSMQTHHRPVTGSPGAPYLYFRRRLLGEGPALHASGSHHPALAENANQYKAAQSLLFTYFPDILSHYFLKSKNYLYL